MKKLIAFAALSALFSLPVKAQSIKGVITDSESGNPLVAAAVTAHPGPKGTISKDDGSYSIQFSKAGNYTVEVSYIGYESQVKEIYVSEENTVLNFALEGLAEELQQVNITALRAEDHAPIAHENIGLATISKRNSGQDIPYLLSQNISVVTTSDAGAGIGYTGLRIRGSDQTRINVTINGIPVNDGESHGVFWVNMPDFASSLQSVQIQRGVGTSTNGAGAFGASLNFQTSDLQSKAFGEIHLGAGSFNTQRATVQFGTGLMNDHWVIQGRLSQIKSDGYVDRARADLKSYFFTGGYIDGNTSLKAVVFGGNEETYQSWYGLDSATYYSDRTLNYAGMKYDTAGNLTGYYDDQVDHYSQNHYQLHLNQVLNDHWAFNLSGHYTRGLGYYEEYQNDDDLSIYGITDSVATGDLVRRLWLDNHFYGAVYNLKYTSEKLDLTLGGAANQYLGQHYGEVVWARYAGDLEPKGRFYFSDGTKNDLNFYGKAQYRILPKVEIFADAQYRKVDLKGEGNDEDGRQISFEDSFNFFNPKIGITVMPNENLQLYASYAVSNREPNRQDYIENEEKPMSEFLEDVEIGTRYTLGKHSLQANIYGMFYKNQLVLTGQLNNVGYPIRKNVGQSSRMGIELSADLSLLEKVKWRPNVTLSRNVNSEFVGQDPSGKVVNYGETEIAFSPSVIAGSVLEYSPVKGLQIALLNKFVGEQYLNNTGMDRYILNDYFLTDVRFMYALPVNFVESLQLQLLINNVTDEQYASNGSVYSGVPYYYAQAGINFMAGVKVRF